MRFDDVSEEHGKINITSLVEWVIRYAVVMRNEDRLSKSITEALIRGSRPLPAGARQSITFNLRPGTEFSTSRRLKDGIGADRWFCDPQGRWQKGAVENTNNQLRKYLPRSTEPTALINRYFGAIRHRLNSTPRKSVGFRTSAEVFESELLAIRNDIEHKQNHIVAPLRDLSMRCRQRPFCSISTWPSRYLRHGSR
ncbi:IS30 family transposase [Oceaniovalibus sp. ACAM 378]|uniref:IS30 family transposase n=1 Tax=Oceaniovalibus sp. ACAM 378 TaxID=2599923 RepID=UPI002101DFC8|nr:IS30 family transposase [Oceaniovalibus sp. ACAM 378]